MTYYKVTDKKREYEIEKQSEIWKPLYGTDYIILRQFKFDNTMTGAIKIILREHAKIVNHIWDPDEIYCLYNNGWSYYEKKV